MGISELLSLDISGKNILIIGSPASGKTWLSNKLADYSHEVIHADDFKHYGYEQGMYMAMDAALCSDKPVIVEGVFGYRMLRSGYLPDIVIEVVIPEGKMEEIYKKERPRKDFKKARQMDLSHRQMLSEYLQVVKEKPKWIIFSNSN